MNSLHQNRVVGFIIQGDNPVKYLVGYSIERDGGELPSSMFILYYLILFNNNKKESCHNPLTAARKGKEGIRKGNVINCNEDRLE